jgi:hypothetical protein
LDASQQWASIGIFQRLALVRLSVQAICEFFNRPGFTFRGHVQELIDRPSYSVAVILGNGTAESIIPKLALCRVLISDWRCHIDSIMKLLIHLAFFCADRFTL